ncbi:RNA-dependent RNA polymerase, partial [viral metagenome]
MYIDNVGNLACMDNWEWVLMGEVDSAEGWHTVRTSGTETIRGWVVRWKNVGLLYVNRYMVGPGSLGWCANVAAVARQIRIPEVRLARVTDLGLMSIEGQRGKYRDLVKKGRELADRADELLPRISAAGDHLTHLRPSDIIKACEKEGGLLTAWANLAYWAGVSGATQASCATSMLWCTSAKTDLPMRLVLTAYVTGVNTAEKWVKFAKYVTMRAKQLQHSCEEELYDVFESEVVINRGLGEVDWSAERKNRTQAVLVPVKEEDVYAVARGMMVRGRERGYRYHAQTWKLWWQSRWLHVPSGSAHTVSTKLTRIREAHKKEDGFSKKVLLSAVSSLDLAEITMLRPEIHAWPSTKYEWGKQRAIYGTDVESFMMFDFAFPSCETAVPGNVIAGERATKRSVHDAVSLAASGMVPLDFDYEDFNSQHSMTSMRAVLRAYIDEYKQDMSEDQFRAACWCLSAINKQVVHSNANLGVDGYEAKDTLLSGWRLTTFMNSVLNYVYLKLAGSIDHTVSTLHSGDDVFAGCEMLG